MIPALTKPVLLFFADRIRKEPDRLVFDYLLDGRVVAQEEWQDAYHHVPSGPGIWLAGTTAPQLTRRLFLFHSVAEALSYCAVHPSWIEKPGANVFAALGRIPDAGQLSVLAATYPLAKLHLVFGSDLLSSVLECKAALWFKGRDASFSLSGDKIYWRWQGRQCSLATSVFSFNSFQQACDLRFGYRTHKPPPGYPSFLALLSHHDS